MTVLMVLLGGAVGAPLRYLIDRYLRSRLGGAFPWGTAIVNVTGSLLVGVLAAAGQASDLPGWVAVLVGTGLLGSLTTFSTFGYETVRLLHDRAAGAALLHVALNLVLGFAACAGGFAGTAALG